MHEEDWLTCEDVADIEGVTTRAIQTRCKNNQLPCIKRGKIWYIDRAKYEEQVGKVLVPKQLDISTDMPIKSNGPLKSVIVFSSAKGGVGKTSLSVITADKLSERLGYRVLLIDQDPQGNATSFSGLKPYGGKNRPSKGEYREAAHDVFLGKIQELFNNKPKINVREAIYQARDFHVLPIDHRSERLKYWLLDNAHKFRTGIEIQKLWTEKFPFLLKDILEDLKDEYDFIIIDTPPELGWATENALMAGTDVVIPIELGSFEVTGLAQVFNFINSSMRKNPKLNILGIAISRYGPHASRMDFELEEQLRTHPVWGNYLFHSVILRTLLIREATINTTSVFDYWRKGLSKNSLQSIDEFTEELIIKINNRIKEQVVNE